MASLSHPSTANLANFKCAFSFYLSFCFLARITSCNHPLMSSFFIISPLVTLPAAVNAVATARQPSNCHRLLCQYSIRWASKGVPGSITVDGQLTAS